MSAVIDKLTVEWQPGRRLGVSAPSVVTVARSGDETVVKVFGLAVYWRQGKSWKVRWLIGHFEDDGCGETDACLGEGMTRKGGQNTIPSQILDRPPPPPWPIKFNR